ncbi:MAG: HAMP domain-containing histidine kinase [Clostridia bacterium]|nr:HAMP domain-containing histidine kinase [Clostridia bacterium]
MIKRLKIKFIALSMVSLFLLLTVVVAGMNIINYVSMVRESDGILELLSKNKGKFPDINNGKGDKLPPNMSPELPYESRYFSVLLREDGELMQVDTGRIATVNSAQATAYAEEVLQKNGDSGFIDGFRYLRSVEGDTTRITFLDCGRRIDSLQGFLLSSVGMATVGYIAVFVAVVFLAGRIIRPAAESYEKQKRFITDAGHEIKTPLTVINANADLLEMELGEHESIDEIRRQSKRLTALTNDLVFLAKMEETENTVPMVDFPLSDIVEEVTVSFRALAQMQNKELICSIAPMLSMQGNSEAIRQLVTILMDNAFKYSPNGGKVTLSLEKRGRSLCLTVFNTTKNEIDREALPLLFERFYRTDPSRNSKTGGHGIGLSIAKAITETHGGRLRASTADGHSLLIGVTFPA